MNSLRRARSRTRSGVVLGIVLAVASAGCSSTSAVDSYIEASRATLYSSVEEMTADSTWVVTGTVVSTEERATKSVEDLALTVVILEISSIVDTSATHGLGDANPPEIGDSIVILQIGNGRVRGPAPMLASGSDYLLFLSASGLPGVDSSAYYVTGGSAGIYRAEASGANLFVSLATDGDKLPKTLSVSDIK